MGTGEDQLGPSISVLNEPSPPPPEPPALLGGDKQPIADIQDSTTRWQGFVAGVASGGTKLLVGHPMDTISKFPQSRAKCSDCKLPRAQRIYLVGFYSPSIRSSQRLGCSAHRLGLSPDRYTASKERGLMKGFEVSTKVSRRGGVIR